MGCALQQFIFKSMHSASFTRVVSKYVTPLTKKQKKNIEIFKMVILKITIIPYFSTINVL